MKRKILVAVFIQLAFIGYLSAQSSSELNISNIRFEVNSNGIIGNDLSLQAPACEVPVGSNTHSMYSSGLWVGGVSLSNSLFLAAQEHQSVFNGDYWSGPLKVDGTASISSSVSQQYDQVWTVYSSDVLEHRAYFDCVDDPNCDPAIDFPGYQVPNYFLQWPAHGDVQLSQALHLAPFFDRNQDGLYEPNNGDHPCVPGDEAKYIIFNDKKTHIHSGGQPIGLEIHAIVYAYATSDQDISNTIFVHYRIINRSTQALSETYVGIYNDLDLGNPTDDYVGYDVERSLSYAYNGDSFDEDGNGSGYGSQPPAFGMTILEGPFLDADGSDAAPSDLQAATGSGFGDGQIDNERFGPSSSAYILGGGGPLGSTTNSATIYNRLRGYWNDASTMLYGGSGHSSDGNADPNTPTGFTFPGSSDPTGLATNGVSQSAWSEAGGGNFPGDRKAITSMGPFTLEAGGVHEIDLAFCYARANSGGPLASVAELQNRVDQVRSFYFNLKDDCGWTLDPSVGINEDLQLNELGLFPSPTNGLVHFDLPQKMLGAQLEVLDLTGRSVIAEYVKDLKTQIDLSEMGSGLFLVRVISEKMIYQGKVIKE